MLKLFDHLSSRDHVIWDWNGTLLNDVDYAVRTVNSLLGPRNLPLLDIPRYQKTFCFPIRKYYELLGFDLHNESFEKICDDFVETFMREIHTCELVPGAREILMKVKDSGKTQSILSATDQTNLDRMMDSFGLRPYLDNVFGIEDKLAAGKIHRGRQLLEISGHEAAKTVLLGDTDHDLEVGEAIGVPVILLAHGHQCADKLRRLHPHVVDLNEPLT